MQLGSLQVEAQALASSAVICFAGSCFGTPLVAAGPIGSHFASGVVRATQSVDLPVQQSR